MSLNSRLRCEQLPRRTEGLVYQARSVCTAGLALREENIVRISTAVEPLGCDGGLLGG
ncbi:hypothetical protein CA54_32940 [Symmachiella macrocystis]|uniref:Uncharacterized protein n=1 Tax=Symmachiella macrocystis TaxID=2527985 RepID=A0A5C6BQW8_9PLAN|nr:hypothetical protein CA54_32940 [Symmachiella macrocystis]